MSPKLAFNIFFANFFFFLVLSSAKSDSFSTTLSPKSLGLKREKLSHLHFFFHDIVAGPNQTAVRVAEAAVTNRSATGFGAVTMMDNPLTAGPEASSKLLGRAQGLYGSADQDELAFLMVMNLAFLEGKYNGSSLSLLGRNAVLSGVREMPIVGGTGVFRFARGYAQAKTHGFTAVEAVVEYDVFVFHY